MNTDAIRERVAVLLGDLAELTGDGRFRHAAGIVIGRKAGRPACDDAAALRLAHALVASRTARSRRAACTTAAKIYGKGHAVDAMRDRLQKKMRQK